MSASKAICIGICVVVATLAWSACGGGESQEPAPPPSDAPEAGEAPAPPAPSAAEVPKPAVEPSAEAIPLPVNFPEDVPHHPEASITRTRGSSDGMSMTMMVDGDPDSVASFYADQFAAKGWATDIRSDGTSRTVLADKEKRQAAAHIRETTEGTEIHLIFTDIN